MDEEKTKQSPNKKIRFWTGAGPWAIIVVLAAAAAYLMYINPELLGQRLSATVSILLAMAALFLMMLTTRVRRAVKEAARKKEAPADAKPVAAETAAQTEDEEDQEEYEFPFLRLMDKRSRLYICCETRSWYAIQFQTVATPSAGGDRMTPSWYPGDVDHDYATKQDIWIAKSDLTGYELDPFPVPNLPWTNSGTLTLTAGETKYSFVLLGDVDEEDLATFFPGKG